MSVRALLTDLDRTLTGADLVPDPRALRRLDALRAAGVRVVLATGRTLEHLLREDLTRHADAVVAENGAVVCVPELLVLEVKAPHFGESARTALGPLGARFTWGRVLGSGPRGLAAEVSARLDAHGVPHEAIPNADEIMLLPAGVDKASGAAAALRHLGLGLDDAWAIGDGENDATMLRTAGLGGAPANAAPEARAAAGVHLVRAHADAFLDFTEPLLAPPLVRRVPVEQERRAQVP